MQRTLFQTRRPGLRASTASSSSSSIQTTPRPTPTASSSHVAGLAGSITSSPLSVDDDSRPSASPSTPTPSGSQILQTTPSADLNSGQIFPIRWDDLWLGAIKIHPSEIGYRVQHKRTASSNARISDIWKDGADLSWQTPQGTERLWLCKICHLNKKPGGLLTVNGNDHIFGHLKSNHNIVKGVHLGELLPANPFEAAKAATAFTGQHVPFWSRGYIQAFIDWAILQDITFRQATSAYTRALLTFDRPELQHCLAHAPTSLSTWITSAYKLQKVDIKKLMISSRSKINISCDIWTSTNGLSLLGVVAHFIDESGKLQSVLLGLPRIRGSHTGENIAQVLAPVLEQYEIQYKLGCLMMDNATNNDELSTHLSRSLPLPPRARLRCVGHIINLIVKALIFGKGISKLERELIGASDEAKFKLMREKGFIGKLHNIVKYIMRSTGRREDFADNQAEAAAEDELFDQLELMLIKDGGVRWNSTYFMAARAVKLKKAIQKYCLSWRPPANEKNGYDLRQDFLTDSDWKLIEQLVKLLKPFMKMTKRMEGDANASGVEGSYGALWESIISLDTLHKHLLRAEQKLKNEDDSFLKSGITMTIQKVNKYFDKFKTESPYYFAAVILHPSLKRAWFADKWRKWPMWVRHAEKSIETLFAEYLEAEDEEEAEELTQPSRRKVPRKPDNDSDDDFEARLIVDEDYATTTRARKKTKLANELQRYYEAGLELHRWKEDDEEFTEPIADPLTWWLTQGSIHYPILTKIALNLFSVPAMSSACERVFSLAKKVVTDERNRLSADTIEADECQKWWLLKGLVPSSLTNCIKTKGSSTTPWLSSLIVDLTGFNPDLGAAATA